MLWSSGEETVLVRGNEMVRDTKVGEKGVDMFFEELTDKTEEGDGSVVGWGAGCRGGFGDGDNEDRGGRWVTEEGDGS